MTITGGATRALFNWEDDEPKTLYNLKFQGNLFKGMSYDVAFSMGSYPDTGKAMDFFSGLWIPGLSLYLPPRIDAYLYMPVTAEHTLGLTYWDDPNRKRPSVLHNYNSQRIPIRIFTEIGYDMKVQKPFFSNRTNYLLDLSGRSMLGLQTRYE